MPDSRFFDDADKLYKIIQTAEEEMRVTIRENPLGRDATVFPFLYQPSTQRMLVLSTNAGIASRERKGFKVYKPLKQKGPDFYDLDAAISHHTHKVDTYRPGRLRNEAMVHMVRLKDAKAQMDADVHEMPSLIGPGA